MVPAEVVVHHSTERLSVLFRDLEGLKMFVYFVQFIITGKVKTRRGGGKMSYTLRNVSLVELVRLCQFGL